MVRKVIFVVCVCLLTGLIVHAQNRSIEFLHPDEISWKEVLKKTKKQKKMIFIDAYTSWCGPCKLMEKEVFTRDEVADYYNKHFVCVKYNIEKDKAIPMNNRYGISCYPTFLYLTPDGEVVHKAVGSCDPEEFIARAKKAINPEQNLAGLEKRYNAGENDRTLLKQYTRVLIDAFSNDSDKIAGEYMSDLNEEEFFSKENWEIISVLNDPTAYPLLKARQNRHEFYKIIEPTVVDNKLKASFMKHIIPYLEKDVPEILDERGLKLIRFLQATGDEPYYLSLLLARDYKARGEYELLLEQMQNLCRYNILNGQIYAYCNMVLKYFSDCQDKAVILKLVTWLDETCKNEFYARGFKDLLQQNRKTLNEML